MTSPPTRQPPPSPPCPRNRTSRTGRSAPAVLCFGTASFGGGDAFFKVWGDVQQQQANRLVEIAIEGGVNFFDTANICSDGLAGTILGHALKGKRGQALLASKSSTPNKKLGVSGASRADLLKFAARTEAQLHDNLGAVGWKLTPQQTALLDRASEQKPAYPYSHQLQFPTVNPPQVPHYDIKKS